MLLHDEVDRWFLEMCHTDPETADQITQALDLLSAVGPALGRPMVDRVHHSGQHHLKELRPGSTGSTEIRLLFAFDPARQAIMLVAGDKSRQWRTWYAAMIPIAEARYAEHLDRMREEPS